MSVNNQIQTNQPIPPSECKYCHSTAIVKYGQYKGVPRYFCKVCKRKFKADADIFHMKVPAEYVSSALSMYYSGMSVNDIRTNLKQEHNYSPSNSVIYKWIEKYTNLARKQFQDYHPQVGNTWVADETMLDVDGQHKVWFYDIIDKDTRFLLASRVAISRTTTDAQMLMEDAKKRAGRAPTQILTDSNYSYLDGIEKTFGSDTEHIQTTPFKTDEDNSTSEIERFHGTLKDRTKVFRSFRDIDTLIQFTDGWLVYYNYFRPHESLNGKTPAESAHLKYDVKDWADLARVPVTKESEIQSHKAPGVRIVKEKVSLERAFKRKRIRKPSEIDLGMGIVKDRRGQHLRLS
jgi:putative transposase